MPRAVELSAATCFVLALTFGCGPQKPTIAPEVGRPDIVYPDIKPIALDVISGDRSMTVRWKQQGIGTISGYNIFIAREPIADKAHSQPNTARNPHNAAVYPGDTDLEDDRIEYVANGLDNGTKYFVSVRVVFPDQSMSVPSNEALAVCGPRGECTLSVRYKSDNDGFSFVTGQSTRADDADNDLYFFSKDGVDYLSSPSRLNSYLRASSFDVITAGGTLEDARTRISSGKLMSERADRIAVTSRNWVLMKTAEKYSVLIHVTGLSGEGDSRRVHLRYAVCPITGEAIF